MESGDHQLSLNLSGDFAVNVYRGCVLPEDHRPQRTTTWALWSLANPENYTEEQLEKVRARLLAGKSWVCFVGALETISAPDHYIRLEPYNNPVRSKERVV